MSWTHELILLLMLLSLMSILLWLLYRTRLGVAVREKIADRTRRRLFVASVSFFVTFATVRGMVFAIRHNILPFHLRHRRGPPHPSPGLWYFNSVTGGLWLAL